MNITNSKTKVDLQSDVFFFSLQDFIDEYLDNVSDGEYAPKDFFNSVTSTFDVFKDINNTNYNTTCELPTSDPELREY